MDFASSSIRLVFVISAEVSATTARKTTKGVNLAHCHLIVKLHRPASEIPITQGQELGKASYGQCLRRLQQKRIPAHVNQIGAVE
jgi:hypothetical protein